MREAARRFCFLVWKSQRFKALTKHMFFWQEGHQAPSLCVLEGRPAEGFVDMWSERRSHLAISNSKGVGGGGEDFVVLPLLNLNWAKWDAHFLLGPIRSLRDATTIAREKLISAGTSIILGDTSTSLTGERAEPGKWEFNHLASPHLRHYRKQLVMHCELVKSTISSLLQSRNFSVGHFHCHTHRCTVPLAILYSPLHCLDSPESSGGPPGPEGTRPHFVQSSYLLLGPGAKSVCVTLVSPSASSSNKAHSRKLPLLCTGGQTTLIFIN